MPWQQHVFDVALEVDDDGRLVYDEIDVALPRQEGKTALIVTKTVRRLTVVAAQLGPQRSIYTAQRRQDARKKLEQDFAELLRRRPSSFPEVTAVRERPRRRTEWKLSMNNGQEHIRFGGRGGGSFWQIDAPSMDAAHGDTLDDGTIDEAFALETDDIEIGIRPTQATRLDPQIWVTSAAGHKKSFYWYSKIVAGRAACESGDHGRVAYFEWSAHDDADPGDPDVWAACSPALGLTVQLRFLEGEWERACRKGPRGVAMFRRSYLNQWPEVPVLDVDDVDRAIPELDWLACRVPASRAGARLGFAVDSSVDGRSTAIAVSDGEHFEITGDGQQIDHRAGQTWAVGRLVQLYGRWRSPVWLDPRGSASALIEDLAKAGVELKMITTAEHVQACASMLKKVKARELRHLGQRPLDRAVEGAGRRKMGDGWLWSRRNSSEDICPLVAAGIAGHAAGQIPAAPGYYGAD